MLLDALQKCESKGAIHVLLYGSTCGFGIQDESKANKYINKLVIMVTILPYNSLWLQSAVLELERVWLHKC